MIVFFQNFTDQHVYGYEPDSKIFNELQMNIKSWNINTTKNVYFHRGLGKQTKMQNNKKIISMLDDEVNEYNMKLGAIKADTEGHGWEIIEGGLESIKKHRPVFLMHVYHCYDEYVRVPKLVRELGNYLYFYR